MLDSNLSKQTGFNSLFNMNKIFKNLKTQKFLILLLLTITLLSKGANSYENPEELKKRLNFYSKIQQFSNNTIKVGSDPDHGLHCVANDYIEYGKLTMKIPKKLSICPYFLFPFKHEIIDALNKVPGIIETIGKEQRFSVYVLIYYLMYFMNGPKDSMKEYIIKHNIEDYLEVENIDESLKDSFPKSMLSVGNFDPEHHALLKELNFPVDRDQELDMIFKIVLQELSSNLHYEMIFPWISDYELFKWAHSIVMSRGMSLRLNEYYNLEEITLTNRKIKPNVRKNLEKNAYMGKGTGVPCVIAFIDLCNHYQPKNIYSMDKLPIVLDTRPGYFINSATANWSPGDEITYTYSNDPNNIVLLSHYGFYIKENIFNAQKIQVEDNYTPTVDQFNLCRELGCFDSKIRNVQQIPKIRRETILLHSLNENILNFARVKYLKGKIDSKAIFKKISMEKFVSNTNEMSALIYYHEVMMGNLKLERKNIINSIKDGQKLQNRINHIEKNWDKYAEEAETTWRKFKISYNILMTDLTYKNIIVKHSHVVLNRILNLNNLDIQKLRSKYLEGTS